MTLIISGLTLNPLIADIEIQNQIVTSEQIEQESIKENISTILYEKGLDKKIAEERVNSFFENHEEISVNSLIKNIEPFVEREKVLTYLSEQALFHKKLKLNSYDGLVAMVTQIQNKKLDKTVLAKLQIVVKQMNVVSV